MNRDILAAFTIPKEALCAPPWGRVGPQVLPAASPRPGGQPHPTRQRAAQGLGLGSQGCCDQVPRVSRHQTAFAHSSGGKEPQAKVSSGLVPPEALKDLALVPPERLAAPATLGPRRLARAPPLRPRLHLAFRAPSGSASAPLLMGAPVTAVGTRRTRTRLPPRKPHCDAGRARRPWRARPWGGHSASQRGRGRRGEGNRAGVSRRLAPAAADAGRPRQGHHYSCWAPPSLLAPGRRRVLPPRLPAALPRPAAEPPACGSICPVSFGSSFGFAWLMPQ